MGKNEENPSGHATITALTTEWTWILFAVRATVIISRRAASFGEGNYREPSILQRREKMGRGCMVTGIMCRQNNVYPILVCVYHFV
jgi:hypothetical protein